jgi:hypothetical protein
MTDFLKDPEYCAWALEQMRKKKAKKRKAQKRRKTAKKKKS